MTAKEKVLAAEPRARHWGNTEGLYVIGFNDGDRFVQLGQLQESIEAAWQNAAESLPAQPAQEPSFSVHRGIFGETIHLTDSRGNVQSIAVQGGLFEGNCKTCGCIWITRERVRECPICTSVDPIPVEAKEKLCPNCNHKSHYALRCGVLIATGSDGEFTEEVRCECLNWVAEPKPTPSTQDDKGSWPLGCVQRAFVEGMKWWQFQHNGSTAFASEVDEAEAEAVNRYGKPQPDSSSIPDEMRIARSKWWDELLKAEGPITIGETFRAFEAGWAAAKGQSNGR